MLKRKRILKRTKSERAELKLKERLALLPGPKWKPKFTNITLKQSRFVETPEMERIRLLPSLGVMVKPKHTLREPDKSDWDDDKLLEFQEREKIAKVEIDRKKTMVAPLYNKGGYQYIGEMPAEIIRNLGKKI